MGKVQNAIILNKYNIDYFQCQKCYFLCTEKPYWLEEAYKESINITDTGLIGRNINLSKVVSILCYFLFNDKKYLDFGGGYGILTRILRDVGFDFYWYDLYTKNLFSRGFEYSSEKNTNLELVTTFEAFEHFVNPTAEIEKIIKLSDNILFTTELYDAKKVPTTDEWWYYSLEHGQHISFYSLETLKFIAKKNNFELYSNKKDLCLFTKKKSKLKINMLFKILGNSIFSRLVREILFIYIKFVKKGKAFDDMLALKKEIH